MGLYWFEFEYLKRALWPQRKYEVTEGGKEEKDELCIGTAQHQIRGAWRKKLAAGKKNDRHTTTDTEASEP
jgi:hypothetical protein